MKLPSFDPIGNLFRTKKQIEAEIAQRRAEIIQAERTLTNVQLLAKQIPDMITELRARDSLTAVVLTVESVKSNYLGDLDEEIDGIRALQELAEQLPTIRKHWEKRRDQLAA